MLYLGLVASHFAFVSRLTLLPLKANFGGVIHLGVQAFGMSQKTRRPKVGLTVVDIHRTIMRGRCLGFTVCRERDYLSHRLSLYLN